MKCSLAPRTQLTKSGHKSGAKSISVAFLGRVRLCCLAVVSGGGRAGTLVQQERNRVAVPAIRCLHEGRGPIPRPACANTKEY